MHQADQWLRSPHVHRKDPLDCHRTLLVAHALASRGVEVQHMLADGSLEDHNATMDRLLDEDRREGNPELYPNGDMFRSKDEVITDALSPAGRQGRLQGRGVAGGELAGAEA